MILLILGYLLIQILFTAISYILLLKTDIFDYTIKNPFSVDASLGYQILILILLIVPFAPLFLGLVFLISVFIVKNEALEALTIRQLFRIKVKVHTPISIIADGTVAKIIFNPQNMPFPGIYGIADSGDKLVYIGNSFFMSGDVVSEDLKHITYKIVVTDFKEKKFIIEHRGRVHVFLNEVAIKARIRRHVNFLLSLQYPTVDVESHNLPGIFSRGVVIL